MEFLKRTWAEIDLDALHHNIKEIRSVLPQDTGIIGVVKADAYGHGDGYIASELWGMGVRFFAVSNLEEALSLRQKEIGGDILILGVTPYTRAADLARWNITQTVYSTEYARALSASAVAAGVTIRCHIKLDTGMGRIGFVVRENLDPTDEIKAVAALPGLSIEGVFSHFSSADDITAAGEAYTDLQRQRFDRTVARLEQEGVRFRYRHLQNSAGIENERDCRYNFVRAGIILYGMPVDTKEGCALDLHPLLSIRSVVSMVKRMPAGNSISYGRHYTTEEEIRIATIPIGYADGYLRCMSGKASVLIRGKRARVIGNVCMDQIMVDVTGIDGVCEGDIATIVGKDGGDCITFDELAGYADTISYELFCLIGKRVPRVYFRGGKEVGAVNYIVGD
jgi:alanine racemase